ncbi:MAG TPA: ATP-binding protein [Verrucomicrobiae bacterium]|jgi:signal transduction histidine kinase|nr:ATP-binding protein [Verrucomicrobiae bacterium]
MAAKPVKFLLVDDLESNLIALEGLLRRDGLELLKARSGPEALELLLAHDVALAFLDVQMPEMNGFELAELMRGTERTRRAPIIFLTAGATDKERRFRGYDAGAVDFLVKPIEPHILRSKADVFFELARQRDELQAVAEEKARLLTALGAAQRELQKHAEQLDERVRERTASLEEINNHLEAFCYTIAHDLRGPLRSQHGFAQALLEDYGETLGETGRDFATRIKSAAARLEDLVDDLLAYSRVSRKEMKLENVSLRAVATQVCEEMAFQIREAEAQVDLAPFDFTVRAHEITLRTALTNLLSNALKFKKDGARPEIEISAEARGKFVRLWTMDRGIGIAPEYFEQIFGVFHRLHKAGEYPGTGVGLAIVKKAIERMGGKVGVEAEEGVGSRFWIDLESAPTAAPATAR